MSRRRRQHLHIGIRYFVKHLLRMFTHPLFVALTVVVNIVTFASASMLYWLEGGINPAIHSMLDAIWWAVATITTVGYGEVVTVTTAGRYLDIALMIIGTTIFLSYIALFSSSLLGPAMKDIEVELKRVEHDLEQLRHDLETQDASKK